MSSRPPALTYSYPSTREHTGEGTGVGPAVGNGDGYGLGCASVGATQTRNIIKGRSHACELIAMPGEGVVLLVDEDQ